MMLERVLYWSPMLLLLRNYVDRRFLDCQVWEEEERDTRYRCTDPPRNPSNRTPSRDSASSMAPDQSSPRVHCNSPPSFALDSEWFGVVVVFVLARWPVWSFDPVPSCRRLVNRRTCPTMRIEVTLGSDNPV